MPRPRKGPHLYLKRREQFGRKSAWIIRDGVNDKSTGCGEAELEGAERALQAYIARKYTPPKAADRLEAILIADVLNVYLTEHAPTVARPDFIQYTAAPIIEWWGTKTLADIRGKTCRDYVTWRATQGVSAQTARHDLKTLRAAIICKSRNRCAARFCSSQVRESPRRPHNNFVVGRSIPNGGHRSKAKEPAKAGSSGSWSCNPISPAPNTFHAIPSKY
jgi:hypothetical protein